MNSIGNNISSLIEKQGLTQKALAEKIGKTETSVSRYINGKRIPDANTIKMIAVALNTTTDFLLKDGETSHSTNCGKWVPWKTNSNGTNYGTIIIYKCSECGSTESNTSPYCRQCGARMDGENAQ